MDLAYSPGAGPASGSQPFGCAFSGETSISLTTKSASLPEVEANRSAATSPVIVRSCSSGALLNVSTSGRPSTKRWSCTSQVRQSPAGYVGEIGRRRYGTGCAGSETYSRYAAPRGGEGEGRSNDRVPSAWRYKLGGFASGGGHAA